MIVYSFDLYTINDMAMVAAFTGPFGANMIVKNSKDIGLIIRERRKAMGMNQESLAAKASVSRPWLISMEAGKATVALKLVLQTFNALGLRLSVNSGKAAPNQLRLDFDIDDVIARARKPRNDRK